MSKCFFDPTIPNKLRNKEMVSAAWCHLGSNISAEIMAEAGFDALVVDLEHAQITLPGLVSLIQSMKGTDCIPIVRVPWNDMVWCKHVLDTGAYGIHDP